MWPVVIEDSVMFVFYHHTSSSRRTTGPGPGAPGFVKTRTPGAQGFLRVPQGLVELQGSPGLPRFSRASGARGYLSVSEDQDLDLQGSLGPGSPRFLRKIFLKFEMPLDSNPQPSGPDGGSV